MMIRSVVLSGVLACFAAAASAQLPEHEPMPQEGIPGKDVIFVAIPDGMVGRLLSLAQTRPEDFVIDLGSGDGKIVIAAAKSFGARGLGIEYNPDLVVLSRRKAEEAGVSDRVGFVEGDIFKTDFSSATVLTMFLTSKLNVRLRPTILRMRPGTRVVSFTFNMDDWKSDESSYVGGKIMHLWIVPADLAGYWDMTADGQPKRELRFEQRFQDIKGWLKIENVSEALRWPTVRGADVAFRFVDLQGMGWDYRGRAVDGGRLEGTFTSDAGAQGRWNAVKR